MYIVKIIGGLGNQMFQYAFGYSMSKTTTNILKLDISTFDSYGLRKYELNNYFIVEQHASIDECNRVKYKQENKIKTFVNKIFKNNSDSSVKYYKEPSFYFNKNIFKIEGDVYFDGYWQSEKYFNNYRDELLKIFTLKDEIHYQSVVYKQQINNTESVGIHIRRGDYVNNERTNRIHGVCELDYYRRAISFLKKKI